MKAPGFITDLTRTTRPMPDRYRQLSVLEPALVGLWDDTCYYARYWQAQTIEREMGKSLTWLGLRVQLASLLGPCRTGGNDDILGSTQAYDCACTALRDAMGV